MKKSQGTGWNNKGTQVLVEIPRQHKRVSRRVRMDFIWEASIVETCLRMTIYLWEMRNEDVHGKEEVTQQQKMRANTAINVRALHKLEEIARPSDSGHETAVKIEGIVTMKTRPVQNSVKKMVDRPKK